MTPYPRCLYHYIQNAEHSLVCQQNRSRGKRKIRNLSLSKSRILCNSPEAKQAVNDLVCYIINNSSPYVTVVRNKVRSPRAGLLPTSFSGHHSLPKKGVTASSGRSLDKKLEKCRSMWSERGLFPPGHGWPPSSIWHTHPLHKHHYPQHHVYRNSGTDLFLDNTRFLKK